MLFKRLNRDQPEQVFVVVENNEGATIVKDQTVQIDHTTDVDGVKSRDLDSGALYCFQGVADADIADGEFGLVQVYGYRSSSQLLLTDTTQAAGLPLVPVAAQEYFASVVSTTASNAAVTQQPIFAVLLESHTTGTGTASKKVFLRGM